LEERRRGGRAIRTENTRQGAALGKLMATVAAWCEGEPAAACEGHAGKGLFSLSRDETEKFTR
ncbi:hypothetical protein A2U01_0094534, partial [Trifolium medium]|nr:hypothetical protein [Trifolium medium]